MALQAECDRCGESVAEYELVYLDINDNQIAYCHSCVQNVIDNLIAEIEFNHGESKVNWLLGIED